MDDVNPETYRTFMQLKARKLFLLPLLNMG